MTLDAEQRLHLVVHPQQVVDELVDDCGDAADYVLHLCARTDGQSHGARVCESVGASGATVWRRHTLRERLRERGVALDLFSSSFRSSFFKQFQKLTL